MSPSPAPAVDGVLFDVDGTLYDRDEAQRRVLARMALECRTCSGGATRPPSSVVSNAFPDVQYRKLESLGLYGRGVRATFRCIVLSEEFGARKPEPSIFRRGCQLLGVAPARCVYVGDSFANDVIGARAAGLVPCWFNPSGAPPANATSALRAAKGGCGA